MEISLRTYQLDAWMYEWIGGWRYGVCLYGLIYGQLVDGSIVTWVERKDWLLELL